MRSTKTVRPTHLKIGALAALSALALAAATPAHAVGTRTFVIDSMSELKGGDLSGVSVDSNGNVSAGLTLGATPLSDVASVWSSAVLADGSVLLGTGNEGKIVRVSGAQVSVAATTSQMAVSALAIAWNGEAIAGTFPEGKLFRVPANNAKPGDAPVFATLPDTEDIWALAFDEKAKVLYAATGPNGKLFRIDAAGKAQVHFDSDEPHLTSVAVADDGTVYTGSNGKALLYKITGPGRASVLYDFDADDVKAISIGRGPQRGVLYAIANKYSEAFSAPKRNKSGPGGPAPSRPGRPGKGLLMRIDNSGVAEKMLDDDDSHYVSLALDENDRPYVGTGAEGRLYTVDENHVARLIADTDERQIGAISVAGKRRFIATTDPAVFHEIKGTGGPDAVWTSKVLDAGLRATFGRLTWRSEGALEFSTRSGNTATPDSTWSAWSVGMTAPGDVSSPAARYIQIRARFAPDPKAILRDVTLAFVTDNARAVVTAIDAAQKGGQSKSGLKTGIVQSGGEVPKPASSVKVNIKVDNPDQDDLRYRLSYRLEGQTIWHNALKPGEKLTRGDYDWDTSALPEGTYRLMVEVTDEMANPPDRVTRHKLESSVVLIDNTPPVFKSLTLTGRKLKGEVVDGVGPIARLEVSTAGSDEWRPLFPSDNVFDEPTESIDVDIASIVPPGPAIVSVRAYDSAGNSVSRNVEAR